MNFFHFVFAVFLSCLLVPLAIAESDEELAKKLLNPIANLVSVPMKYNYDSDYGSGDEGEVSSLVFQPVIPMELNENWNLISRTILPLIDQSDVPPGSGAKGWGFRLQATFLFPK